MLITSFTQKIEDWALKRKRVYQIAQSYYRDVTHRESVLANVTEKDHVLCIGGGVCPFTAILFHEQTGAKVSVIDKCEHCVEKAKRLIDDLGLSDAITVLTHNGDCASFPLNRFTVVHFALQVCPMRNVFHNIEKRVSPGTRLLVRRPKRPLSNLYSCLPSPLLHSCPVTTHKSVRNIGSTLLYIKQGGLSRPVCGSNVNAGIPA